MPSEIVDLSSVATTEQIARFNSKFIPEHRLSDEEFLEWKYRTPTSEGAEISLHYGILDRNEIVGEITTQPMRAWINGEWQPCNYFSDWYVDPNYKGTGRYLLNHIISQTSSLLACSASERAYSIYRRQNFSLMPIDQRFIFFSRPIGSFIATRNSPRRAARLLQKWSKRPFARIPKFPLEGDLELSETKSLDPDLLAGWESDLPEETIFVRRETWMFSWLLDKFPFPEFRMMVLSSAGVQVGYVLLHLRKKDNGLIEGKIVDLFARGWKQSHLIALFSEGTRLLIKLGSHIVSYHATHPLFISLAVDSGFTKTHNQSVIMYGSIAEAMGSGQVNLHITYYDQDEAYY